MKPVAITAWGVVSTYGVGWDAFRAGITGEAGAAFGSAPTALPSLAGLGVRAAEVASFDPRPIVGDKGLRNNDRLTKLLLVAARLGLEAAGLKREGAFAALGADDIGVCGSTAYGSLEAIHELHTVALREDPRYLNPARFPNTVINSSVGYVSIWEELRALNATVTNGPTGALDALDAACTWIAAGRAKAVLAGGAEALSEGLWQGFRRAGAEALTRGEGACLAVLEDEAAARARGATVHAVSTGYGSAFDPGDEGTTMVRAGRGALERALRLALADAGIEASDVTLALIGRSGLASFDAAEREAIAAVLGDVPAVAPKEWIGETRGAAGAFAVAFGCAVSGAGYAVVTSLGFYGNASALVFRRAE